jgi:hypothetical protein
MRRGKFANAVDKLIRARLTWPRNTLGASSYAFSIKIRRSLVFGRKIDLENATKCQGSRHAAPRNERNSLAITTPSNSGRLDR